jgi:hypothetical protein
MRSVLVIEVKWNQNNYIGTELNASSWQRCLLREVPMYQHPTFDLIKPHIPGILYDATGTYIYSFYLGGTSILVSCLILFPTWCWMKPKHLSEVDTVGSRAQSLLDEEM